VEATSVTTLVFCGESVKQFPLWFDELSSEVMRTM